MEINIVNDNFYNDEFAQQFLKILESNEKEFNLENAVVYYNYPLFKETDEEIEFPSFFIVSPTVGLIIINGSTKHHISDAEILKLDQTLANIESSIFSKLIKSKNPLLKKNKREINVNLQSLLFFNNYYENDIKLENEVLTNIAGIKSFFEKM